MRKNNFIIFVFVLLLFSCKKATSPEEIVDPNLVFLKNAASDPCNDGDFFIKGEFNGHKICLASTGASGSYSADTSMNVYYAYHDATGSWDDLHLKRQNANGSIMIVFYCNQTHIKDRTLPYSEPPSNLENCEFIEMRLINMTGNSTLTQNWPQSPFHNDTFLGYTGFGITVTFTSFTSDNVIEGNFEGTIRTDNGSIINVKNGKFRIRVVIVETGSTGVVHL